MIARSQFALRLAALLGIGAVVAAASIIPQVQDGRERIRMSRYMADHDCGRYPDPLVTGEPYGTNMCYKKAHTHVHMMPYSGRVKQPPRAGHWVQDDPRLSVSSYWQYRVPPEAKVKSVKFTPPQ